MASVLIVTSSHRKGSNSHLLSQAVATGAKEKGHAVEIIDISHKLIHPCRGCQSCLKNHGKCVIDDDMQPLYPLINAADILLLASPIYWFNLCGQIKQFIDRCYAVAVPSRPELPSQFAQKSIGGIFTFGGEDAFSSGCVNAIRSLQDICSYTGATWLSSMYGRAYEVEEVTKDPALLAKARMYGNSL